MKKESVLIPTQAIQISEPKPKQIQQVRINRKARRTKEAILRKEFKKLQSN